MQEINIKITTDADNVTSIVITDSEGNATLKLHRFKTSYELSNFVLKILASLNNDLR